MSLRISKRDVTLNETPNMSKNECISTPECFSEDMVETGFATNIYFDPLDGSNFEDSRNLNITLMKEEIDDSQQEESHQVEYSNYGDVHEDVDKILSIEGVLQKILKEMNENTKDEDRQFVLSLLPSLKKLNVKKKFKAKIQMMKVLEKMSEGD